MKHTNAKQTESGKQKYKYIKTEMKNIEEETTDSCHGVNIVSK